MSNLSMYLNLNMTYNFILKAVLVYCMLLALLYHYHQLVRCIQSIRSVYRQSGFRMAVKNAMAG